MRTERRQLSRAAHCAAPLPAGWAAELACFGQGRARVSPAAWSGREAGEAAGVSRRVTEPRVSPGRGGRLDRRPVCGLECEAGQAAGVSRRVTEPRVSPGRCVRLDRRPVCGLGCEAGQAAGVSRRVPEHRAAVSHTSVAPPTADASDLDGISGTGDRPTSDGLCGSPGPASGARGGLRQEVPSMGVAQGFSTLRGRSEKRSACRAGVDRRRQLRLWVNTAVKPETAGTGRGSNANGATAVTSSLHEGNATGTSVGRRE